MNQPLVTVYIATHNRPEMLKRALKSVYEQTYSNIEIIVSDDGSTPPAIDSLQAELEQHDILVLRSDAPKGACHARNVAINAASGEFITGLDDDDAFLPTRVEELVNAFLSAEGLSCVTGCITEATGAGYITRQHDAGLITVDMMRHYNFMGNQVLTKTEYLRAIGGFDEKMPAMQDYDTWLRLMERFGSALKLKSASYLWYTDHEQNRITKSSTKRTQAFARFLHKHRHKMNQDQLNSMRIIELKMQAKPLTWIEAIRRINRYNKRSIIALLIQHYLGGIARMLSKVRNKGKLQS